MASGMASFTRGDLHSITTTGRPFRNSTMSGMMWCSVPRTRTLNWQTAMKRLFSRFLKSTKWTVGLCSPVLPVPVEAGVLKQQIEDVPIVLQQLPTRKAGGELFDDFVDLIVLQPGIDNPEPLAQHRQHHHLGEASTMAVGGELPVVEVKDLPAKPDELIQEWFLDVVALVHAKRMRRHACRLCGWLEGTRQELDAAPAPCQRVQMPPGESIYVSTNSRGVRMRRFR